MSAKLFGTDLVCGFAGRLRGQPIDAAIPRFKEVFGTRAYSIPVSSIKGNTGNPLAAAGVHQVVATSLAFRNSLIPPTANLERPDPDCDLDIVTGAPRMARLRCALINTHGLGGRNGSLVVGRVNEP